MARGFAGIVLITLALGGCRGPSATGVSPAATPSASRIGVVDLVAVGKGHPRWPEVEAVNKRLAEIEAQLAQPPPLPPMMQARIQIRLRAQARKLQVRYQQEITSLGRRQEERLARYVARVRAEQEAPLRRLRAQLGADYAKAVEARVQALRADLRQYELQVLDAYRFPMANLRLKADVVGVATEEELRRITAELDRLLTERDAKIRARAEVLDVVLRDFQKAREVEATARLERAGLAAEAETRRLTMAKERELVAETKRLARGRQRAFQARLASFRQGFRGIGEDLLDSAQRRYVEGLRQREQQLLAERQALMEQRQRLEDTILADVKIEVAAIAASRGLDVVLTRTLVNVAGEDLTQQIIARIKR